MWVIEYERGWGTRFERSFHKLYTSRKPTKKEAVGLLHKYGFRDVVEGSCVPGGSVQIYEYTAPKFKLEF